MSAFKCLPVDLVHHYSGLSLDQTVCLPVRLSTGQVY